MRNLEQAHCERKMYSVRNMNPIMEFKCDYVFPSIPLLSCGSGRITGCVSFRWLSISLPFYYFSPTFRFVTPVFLLYSIFELTFVSSTGLVVEDHLSQLQNENTDYAHTRLSNTGRSVTTRQDHNSARVISSRNKYPLPFRCALDVCDNSTSWIITRLVRRLYESNW